MTREDVQHERTEGPESSARVVCTFQDSDHPIAENQRLVVMTDEIDWTDLEKRTQWIRRGKLKNEAGRPPHLRARAGALVLRARRKMTHRETEDQIRYYAPARYLCGLTETEWSPDANTIQDLEQLLGEDGIRQINEQVSSGQWSVGRGRHSAAGGDPLSDGGWALGRFHECGATNWCYPARLLRGWPGKSSRVGDALVQGPVVVGTRRVAG